MVHRVAETSHLVLQFEELCSIFGVRHILEAELMVSHMFHDAAVALEEAVGPGEVGHVNRDVVAVVRSYLLIHFAEPEPLIASSGHTRCRETVLGTQRRGGTHHFLVKAGNPSGRAGLNPKFNVRNAEDHIAEARRGSMAAKTVAPWADDRNMVGLTGPGEASGSETFFHGLQSALQKVKVRQDHADMARDPLGISALQMELLLAHVDPHVLRPHREVRVVGESQPDDIEESCYGLVGDAQIDVLERYDVADVFLAIIARPAHRAPPFLFSEFSLEKAKTH